MCVRAGACHQQNIGPCRTPKHGTGEYGAVGRDADIVGWGSRLTRLARGFMLRKYTCEEEHPDHYLIESARTPLIVNAAPFFARDHCGIRDEKLLLRGGRLPSPALATVCFISMDKGKGARYISTIICSWCRMVTALNFAGGRARLPRGRCTRLAAHHRQTAVMKLQGTRCARQQTNACCSPRGRHAKND